jgi:acetoin utilization deacetylase AcuC-like enzyme
LEGLAANLAGGTHHAHSDHGQGFCMLNDVAIAARAMQEEALAGQILIIDCDVHQGNGTAAIFSGDSSVYTFSIHGARNFPFRKMAGDLDIALPDGTRDREYLASLAAGLEHAFGEIAPDLAIYIAGADPYIGDRLGRMALSKDGLAHRDRMILNRCRKRGVPVAIVLGGGYGKRITDTVDIHYQTIRVALEFSGR